MPYAPLHPCAEPGCRELVRGAPRCPRHTATRAAERSREDRARRGSARSRGYSARWDRASRAFLWANPLCRPCSAAGRTTAAVAVDHVAPWQRGATEAERQALFWDAAGNWQPICHACHNTKTAQERGR